MRPSSLRARVHRSRWITLGVAILAYSGLTTLLYSPFLPVPPPVPREPVLAIPTLPVPWAFAVVALVDVIAAAGMIRLRPWGRFAGVAAAALSVYFAAPSWLSDSRWRDLSAGGLASWALQLCFQLGPTAVVLYALWRHWPQSGPEDPRGGPSGRSPVSGPVPPVA